MEASALTQATSAGLIGRRSPLLRLARDDRLIALIRDGHDRAFEVLFDRYQGRLLGFCRHMVGSPQDAEDVLQDVFVSAHAAMLADHRAINVRPWLYRIARNRCLNHLRRPTADGQDTMDIHASDNGASTAERVQKREELRALFADVRELPETQRSALLLREIDALSYEEIAEALETTVSAVKSLLVRARMALAEASESRTLTCDEVRLELAAAAEGLRRATGPVRHHVRNCDGCTRYRSELRASSRALAGIAPIGLLAGLKHLVTSKIGGSSSTGSAGGGTAGGGAAGAGAGAAGSGATLGGALTLGGAMSGIGGALGAKAVTGLVTAAFVAGAVGVHDYYQAPSESASAVPTRITATGVATSISTDVRRSEATATIKATQAAVAPATQESRTTVVADTEPASTVAPTETATTEPAVDPAPATEPTTDGGASAEDPPADDQVIADPTSTEGTGGGPTAGGSSTDDGTGTIDDGTGGGPTYTDPPADDAPAESVSPDPAVVVT